jgi:DNA polymerase-3 subunit gamma/tau
VEIAACADALRRDPRPATRFLFLRSVRKLTRRYDSVLWESDDARARTAQEKAAKIEEMLFDLPPDEEEASERERAEFLEGVVAACTQLAALWRGDGISIGQIRRLSAWAHVTAASSRKIAILENADRMQEAARNALLKLLEEPPAQVHLLVLSPRREAIIPTIRSRMRPYPFAQRSAEEEREVLAKIFRAEPERYRTLRAFFLAWKEINPEALSTFASRFMERVAEAGPSVDIAREIEEVLPGGRNQKETAASLLEELTLRFRSLLRENAVPLDTLEEWSRAMRESQQKLELYNIHPASVVEALFHRMRLSGPRYGAAAAGSGSR